MRLRIPFAEKWLRTVPSGLPKALDFTTSCASLAKPDGPRKYADSYRPRPLPATAAEYESNQRARMRKNPVARARSIMDQVTEPYTQPGQTARPEVSNEAAMMPNFHFFHRVLRRAAGEQSVDGVGFIDKYVSVAEWEKAEAEAHAHLPPLMKTEALYGGLMHMTASFVLPQLGQSLMDYLRTKNLPVTVAVLSRYMSLLGRSADEGKILQAYEELKKFSRAGLFDARTSEHVIAALYRTSQWKECLRMLDVIAVTGKAGPTSLSAVVAGAFLHDEPETAYKYLGQLCDNGFILMQPAYGAWFQYASKRGRSTILEMLEFLNKSEWYLPLEVALGLKEWMETHEKWTGKLTTVSLKYAYFLKATRTEEEYLSPIRVGKEEFEKLRQRFIKLVVETSDVFLRTNPRELKIYREFIAANGPFDLVMDGLNVAYVQTGGTGASNRQLARQLRTVAEYVTSRQANPKRLLILGRKHMNQWPAEEMRRVHKVATCFFAENISQDDPYLLYAALYSGMQCDFISSDLMRDHRFKLEVEDELRKTFLKWQRTHQLQVLRVYPDGTVRLKAPMKFDTIAQWTGDSMHIPYDSGASRGLHELPSSWLCLRKS